MGTPCFWIEPSGVVRRYLRRYAGVVRCGSSGMGYCDARFRLEDEPARKDADGVLQNSVTSPDRSDPRWPLHCACGYVFKESDNWQLFCDEVYVDSAGAEYTLKDAPPGAMYDATWYPWKGTDGRSIIVILPDSTPWAIDGQANNCGIPDDFRQERHHCWIRHGEPPALTVDKNGVTCPAGAGSIQTSRWHGYLTNGVLDTER